MSVPTGYDLGLVLPFGDSNSYFIASSVVYHPYPYHDLFHHVPDTNTIGLHPIAT